ncbi:hypothetical protein HJ590_08950 [Naumannella sp. ID2617S]|nr:hypothetical protein [Naumannella sp. ID2617S]
MQMQTSSSWARAVLVGWCVTFGVEFVVLAVFAALATGVGGWLEWPVLWFASVILGTIPGLALAGLVECATHRLRNQWWRVLAYAVVFGTVTGLASPFALVLVTLPVLLGRIAAMPFVPISEPLELRRPPAPQPLAPGEWPVYPTRFPSLYADPR